MINHSASTLYYRLLEGRPCLEPLRILAAHSAAWRRWEVAFYVLGASHAVCLRRAGVQITELLSCLPPAEALRAHAEFGAAEPHAVCLGLHDLVCRVELTPFPLIEGDALRGAFAETDRLTMAYPAQTGEQTPLTRVGWRLAPQQLAIETVHTYPEEGRGIRSRTVFVCQEAEA